MKAVGATLTIGELIEEIPASFDNPHASLYISTDNGTEMHEVIGATFTAEGGIELETATITADQDDLIASIIAAFEERPKGRTVAQVAEDLRGEYGL